MSNNTMSQGHSGLKAVIQAIRNFFRRLMFVYFIIIGSGLLTETIVSQTGPGGVGDWTTNKIWLKENVYQSATEFWWNDMSGNGNDFAQFTQSFMPTVVPGVLNGRQAIHFNGSTQFLGSVTAPNLYNSAQYTSFIVLKPTGSNPLQTPFYNANGGANSGYYFNINSSVEWEYGVGFGNSYYIFDGGPANAAAKIFTGSQSQFFVNGNQIPGTPGTHAPNLSNNALLGKNPLGNFYNGDIAEVITFNYMLNTAERVIVENYLSSKYLVPIAQDYYDDIYNHDVAGIGQININNSHNQSASNILNIENYNLTPNQWLFFGHNGAGLTKVNSTNVPGGIVKRLEQAWHVDITNASSLLCSLKINIADIPVSMWEDMRLIVDNDTDFTNGAILFPPTMFTGNDLHFGNVTLADGQYITLGTINPNNLIFDSMIVWNTAGGGPGSFSFVLNYASFKPGADTVRFVLPPGSEIEVNNDNTPVIDGDSTYIDADYGHDGIPDIMIKPLTPNMNGIVINSNYNTITGLVITGFNPSMNNGAVYFSSGSHHNRIFGCYIGTDMTGLTVPGNATNSRGIYLDVGSHHNQIGDTTAFGRNIISGNTEDALFFNNDSSNIIVNNVIGLNTAGESLSNGGNGIRMEGSLRNQIGNGTAGGRNVIGGNSLGINILNSNEIIISGNLIGINESNNAHGNMNGGIRLMNSYYNMIGGTLPGSGNVISNSGESNGITLEENSNYNMIYGNFIGTDISGNIPMGNAAYGINLIQGANYNSIGNGTYQGRNVISGNGSNGVNLEAGSMYSITNNQINYNYIGTGADSTVALPNWSGIYMFSNGQTMDAANNFIQKNIIANNNNYGINLSGSKTYNQFMYRNSIYSNTAGGIILQDGAQNNVLPPVIDSLKNATVYGHSNNNALIQVYIDLGNQGRYFKGDVTAHATTGKWQYTFSSLPFNVNITALQSVGTNSSAFSNPFPTPTDSLLVNSTLDNGSIGTLRVAIEYANYHPGPDTIKFELPVNSSIDLQQTELDITSNGVYIDGDLDDDGKPDIEITTTISGDILYGFNISGSGNLLKGLLVNGFDHSSGGAGIYITGLSNKITGCYVGTDKTGMNTHGNNTGLLITGGNNNIIGTGLPQEGNVISGNLIGLYVSDNANGNHILGNLIGTDMTGLSALPNNYGIYINNADSNFIGNGTVAGRNIISGNNGSGIFITSADLNKIAGNYIGADITGSAALPNERGVSIDINSMNNRVGDYFAGYGNIISGNSYDGVYAFGSSASSLNNDVIGNLIGIGADSSIMGNGNIGIHIHTSEGSISMDTIGYNIIANNTEYGISISGMTVSNNVIYRNSIYNHSIAGIYIEEDNQLNIQPPVVDTVIGNTVYGQADSLAHIQLFFDDGDEGRVFLSETTADIDGNWSISGLTLPINKYLTALQTKNHNTSAFSIPNDGLFDYLLVTSTKDDGSAGTLRSAIAYANTHPGADTIKFALDAGSTIGLSDRLTITSDSVFINGDLNDDGIPDIMITNVNNQISSPLGFHILGSHNTLKGLVISGFLSLQEQGTAVHVHGAHNKFISNYIGTNINGTMAKANGIGMFISDSLAYENQIGDGTEIGRNVISGNRWGLLIYQANRNSIAGNIIGLKADGLSAIETEEWTGIYIDRSDSNIIGNGTHDGRNIVSGHIEAGIRITHGNYNKVRGNWVGLDITGMNVIRNIRDGIEIGGGGLYNQIGDTTVGGRNVVAGSWNNINFHSLSSKRKQVNLPITENSRELIFEIMYNKIIGNYIGTDITGQNIFPALSEIQGGILFDNTDYNHTGSKNYGNQVGGPTLNYGNVIAGCNDGISLVNADSNFIANNWIGTNQSLNADLGNTGNGIVLMDEHQTKTLQENSINGGTTKNLFSNNVIAFNDSVGLIAKDPNTKNNKFSYNRFYENGRPVEIRNGAQSGIAAPVIDSMNSAYRLFGTGLPNAKIYIYNDSSSNPQGRMYLDMVTADGTGHWSQIVPFYPGRYYRVIQENDSNSSEFSNAYLPPQIGTLVADKSPLQFVNVLAGDTAADEIKLTVTAASVLIDSIKLKYGAHYSFTPSQSIPFTIGLADTLVLDVMFMPTDFADFPDTILVYNNSSVSPMKIAMAGTGVAGTLSASAGNLNFGTRLVGDSADASVVFKSETGMVQISQITQGIGGAVDFKVAGAPSVPRILHAGIDSMIVTMRFKPVSAGAKVDTLKIYSNSSPGEYLVYLSGTATVNQAPNAFVLKSPLSMTLTNDRTPNFAWEGKGDPDNDALTYIIDVSKASDFSSFAYRDTTADTSQTAVVQLDTVGIYYWRVTAYDGRGGSTVSNTGSFRIDAKSAVLTAGTFFGTVTKQYLSVNVISNKLMASLQGKLVLRNTSGVQIDSVVKVFDLKSAANRFYQTPYKLSETGRLYITVTGTDSAQNVTVVQKNYSVMWYMKQQSLAIISDDGKWQITAPKLTAEEDGFMLVHELNSETVTVHEQSLVKMAKASEGWTTVNEGLSILGSSAIREGQRLTVMMRYDEDMISELQTRYADYDERKIGMYAEVNGEWMYIGGEGRNGQVQAKMKDYGKVKLMYNPEHEFLPTKVELAQNYPNPFNPTTTIKFGVPQEGKVKLTIYNVLGQKVKELVNESRSAGYHTMIWNGRSDNGHIVSSGVYLYRLETTQGTAVKKMMFVK